MDMYPRVDMYRVYPALSLAEPQRIHDHQTTSVTPPESSPSISRYLRFHLISPTRQSYPANSSAYLSLTASSEGTFWSAVLHWGPGQNHVRMTVIPLVACQNHKTTKLVNR